MKENNATLKTIVPYVINGQSPLNRVIKKQTVLSRSRSFLHYKEAEIWLLSSQYLATDPYPDSCCSTPLYHLIFLSSILMLSSHLRYVIQMHACQNPVSISLFCHARHISRLRHHRSFYDSSNIWWMVKITNVINMHFLNLPVTFPL